VCGVRLRHLFAVALGLLVLGCGPTGPNDAQGEAADPAALLQVLPVPTGLRDDGPARPVGADVLLRETIGRSTPEEARRLAGGSGLQRAALRTFTTPGGGRMAATVSVWPSNLVAGNIAIVVAQQRLGQPGVRAWTPEDVPGSQGIREDGGSRERLVARAVGPNTFVVRATGDVPDDAVSRTLQRLVTVQEGRDD
jgi:hypothetical protein